MTDANIRTDIPEGLAAAVEDFLAAARRYREYLKRHHRDRLHGVIFAENEDGELVLYSEGQVFTEQIKEAVARLKG